MASAHETSDVVIIGAGVSGISAALTLLSEETKPNFCILEATDRVGGRVHDIPSGEVDNPICLGATWLHSCSDNPLFQFAKLHGLLRDDIDEGTTEDCHDAFTDTWFDTTSARPPLFLREGGVVVPYELVIEGFKIVQDILKRANELCGKVEDTERTLGDLAREMWHHHQTALHEKYSADQVSIIKDVFDMRMKEECLYTGTSSPDNQSLNGYGCYRLAQDTNNPPVGGFSRIVEKLSAPLLEHDLIRFGNIVCAVAFDESEHVYTISCENGKLFKARHVISTVSVGVLKSWLARDVLPKQFPATLRRAINNIGFARVEKVHIEYSTFWWHDIAKDVIEASQVLKSPKAETVCGGLCFLQNTGTWEDGVVAAFEDRDPIAPARPILTFWLMTDAADFLAAPREDGRPAVDEAVVLGRIHKFMDRMVGRTTSEPIGLHWHAWGADRFILGSYSYIAKGASPADGMTLRQGWAPQEASLFLVSGEATHENLYSTTQAAFISGERDARRVLSALHGISKL